MNYRKDSGEVVTGESWLMRNVWDTKRGYIKGMISFPRKLKSTGVNRLIEDALWSQSIRKKLEEGKKRHDFQGNHGFRKWFKTQCELAGMKSINIEILMGHSVGISDSYYRETQDELFQDYLKAVNFLTIDDTLRLRKQFEELSEKAKDDDYVIKMQEKDEAIQSMTIEPVANTTTIKVPITSAINFF